MTHLNSKKHWKWILCSNSTLECYFLHSNKIRLFFSQERYVLNHNINHKMVYRTKVSININERNPICSTKASGVDVIERHTHPCTEQYVIVNNNHGLSYVNLSDIGSTRRIPHGIGGTSLSSIRNKRNTAQVNLHLSLHIYNT